MIHWLIVNNYTKLDVPTTWVLHAIEAEENATTGEIKDVRAACGVLPARRRGWNMDLFVEKKCARCLRKLGLACARCRGIGAVESALKNTHQECYDCLSTGEAGPLAKRSSHTGNRKRT